MNSTKELQDQLIHLYETTRAEITEIIETLEPEDNKPIKPTDISIIRARTKIIKITSNMATNLIDAYLTE